MDIQLEANKNSALFSVLAKMDPFNPYIHKNKPSTINLRKQIVRVLPDNISTLQWGSTMKFSIPRWGLLSDAHLQVEIQGDPTQVAGHLFGLNMMKEIRITSKSRTLFTGTPEYFMGRFCELPEDQRRLLEAAVCLPSEFTKGLETLAARGLSGPLGTWKFGTENEYDGTGNQQRNNGLPHITEGLGALKSNLGQSVGNVTNAAQYHIRSNIPDMVVRATTGGAKHHKRGTYTYDVSTAKGLVSSAGSRNRIMVPFFPPFAENMIQALDVNFCEEIQIECTPKSYTELFATQCTDPLVSFTSASEASTCQFADNGAFKRRQANSTIWRENSDVYGIKSAELVVTFIQLTGEDWAQMRAAMFKEGSGYTQLTFETRSESRRQFTASDGYSMFNNSRPEDWGRSSNYLDIPLNVNNLAYCTKFMVRRSHEVLQNTQAPKLSRFTFKDNRAPVSAAAWKTNKANYCYVPAANNANSGSTQQGLQVRNRAVTVDGTTNTAAVPEKDLAVAPRGSLVLTSQADCAAMMPLDQHVYEEQGDAAGVNTEIECQKRYTSTLQVGYFQLLASGVTLFEQSGDDNLLLSRTCPSFATGTKRRDRSAEEPDMSPDIYTIWYGCKHERTAYSGSLSLQNLNNPTLRIWLKGGLTNEATGKTYDNITDCLRESVLVGQDTAGGDHSQFSAHPGLSSSTEVTKALKVGTQEYYNIAAGCDKLKGPWFDRDKGVAPCFGQGASWNDMLPVSGGTASAMAVDKGTIGRYVEVPQKSTYLYTGTCQGILQSLITTFPAFQNGVNATRKVFLPPLADTIWSDTSQALLNPNGDQTQENVRGFVLQGGHPNRLRFLSDEAGSGMSSVNNVNQIQPAIAAIGNADGNGDAEDAQKNILLPSTKHYALRVFANNDSDPAGKNANYLANDNAPATVGGVIPGNGTKKLRADTATVAWDQALCVTEGKLKGQQDPTLKTIVASNEQATNGVAIFQDLCLNGIGHVPGNTGPFDLTQAEPGTGPATLRMAFQGLQNALAANRTDDKYPLWVDDKGKANPENGVWGAQYMAGDDTTALIDQETTSMHHFVGAPTLTDQELVTKTDIGKYLTEADKIGVVVDVWHENFSLQMINSGNGVITVAYGQ